MSQCFLPNAEMNDADDADLTFIQFNQYKNISSCYLHKQLLFEHDKTYPSCTNINTKFHSPSPDLESPSPDYSAQSWEPERRDGETGMHP